MKFTVSQSALAKALLVVTKGMATNSTLPILSGVYIKAADGMLEFQATNLTISIRHKIAANVEDEGETVVSGKILTNIVKTLPDSAVTFEGLDRIVAITCDKSHFRLNTLDPRDFPEFPQVSLERSIELPCSPLRRTSSALSPPTPTAWPSATPTWRHPALMRRSAPSSRAARSMTCSPCRP